MASHRSSRCCVTCASAGCLWVGPRRERLCRRPRPNSRIQLHSKTTVTCCREDELPTVMINGILDLSKVEAGCMERELADFNLPSAIDDALTLLRERRRGGESRSDGQSTTAWV